MIAQALARAGNVPRTEIRARIDDILSRPEFAQGESAIERALHRAFDKLVDFLSNAFGIGTVAAAHLLQIVVYALIAIAIGIVAWRILRTARASAREPEAARADLESVRRNTVTDLRSRAARARAAGDRLLALRLYFTALVVGLGEAGNLEYRDAWTNRELFERGRPKPDVQQALAPVMFDLDRKSFGGAEATEEDVSAMASLVDRLLGTQVQR